MKITVLSSITIALSFLVFLEQDVCCAESPSRKRSRSNSLTGTDTAIARSEIRSLRADIQALRERLKDEYSKRLKDLQAANLHQSNLFHHNKVLANRNRVLADENRELARKCGILTTQRDDLSRILLSSLVPTNSRSAT